MTDTEKHNNQEEGSVMICPSCKGINNSVHPCNKCENGMIPNPDHPDNQVTSTAEESMKMEAKYPKTEYNPTEPSGKESVSHCHKAKMIRIQSKAGLYCDECGKVCFPTPPKSQDTGAKEAKNIEIDFKNGFVDDLSSVIELYATSQLSAYKSELVRELEERIKALEQEIFALPLNGFSRTRFGLNAEKNGAEVAINIIESTKTKEA